MKYTRLSKEQFESLHYEFSQFLAAQSIDKHQWKAIKTEQPERTEELLDVFSDMVWDRSLEQITYLENRSDYHLFLFKCGEDTIDLILIRLQKDCPSLMREDYRKWLEKNISDPRVSVYEASRKFADTIKMEKYKLMEQGACVSDGKSFEDLKSFLSK